MIDEGLAETLLELRVEVIDNAARVSAESGGSPKLTIVIPTFHDDASRLLRDLAACDRSGEVEIIVYEDGPTDRSLRTRLQSAADTLDTPVRILRAAVNRGRSAARNVGAAAARAEWIVLLDADMAPDSRRFLAVYLDAIETAPGPAIIVGGFSLHQSPRDARFSLHRWQSMRSECRPAEVRSSAPAWHVFTSNLMVHRSVLDREPFDESFKGWGWEDVEWGLRTEAHAPIIHIDNTASHLGLDDAATLIGKYVRSGHNFVRLINEHPETLRSSQLYRAARLARRAPLKRELGAAAKWLALDPLGVIPLPLRGRALKVLRAVSYAEALA